MKLFFSILLCYYYYYQHHFCVCVIYLYWVYICHSVHTQDKNQLHEIDLTFSKDGRKDIKLRLSPTEQSYYEQNT